MEQKTNIVLIGMPGVVGEQTSNGQKTAFTFSMIQYPFVSFLKVILII